MLPKLLALKQAVRAIAGLQRHTRSFHEFNLLFTRCVFDCDGHLAPYREQ